LGLENLISNNIFYYGVYAITLGMIGTIGCAIVHVIDLKTSKWSVYQMEHEGKKAYERRLGRYVY